VNAPIGRETSRRRLDRRLKTGPPSHMAAERPPMIIRPCFQQDLEYVQLIYAHHVLSGAGTFEIEPPSLEEMTERWSRIVDKGWPFLVASPLSDLSRVLGFAYAVQYRDRAAYSKTFESSVYVGPTTQRQGAGALLMSELLTSLRSDGVREVLAFIGDSYNASSIGLHKKLGFNAVGKLENVGEKHGRMLDVVIMQRTLPPPKA
jgi:L-amino acid N-acyltransferase YncA